MSIKARQAFWDVALGNNSKLANLAKLAIQEAENESNREPLEQELYEALVDMQNIMYAEAGVRSFGADKLIARYEAAHGITKEN